MAAPVSVADLVAQAGNYTYNGHIPLAAWLRTASTMQKEAQVYEQEGNDAQMYLLLYRHADLVLQKLQTHPDRNRPENRRALNAATTTVYSDLKKLEAIAPRIKRRHEEYEQRRGRQLDALKTLEGQAGLQELDGEGWKGYESRPALDAQENQSLAARLAQREVHRRDTVRRSGGLWDHVVLPGEEGQDLSSQLQEVARLQQNGHRTSYSSRPSSQSTTPYNYPSVPHKSAQERWSDSTLPPSLPARPPKEHIYRPSASPSIPPPLPPKPLITPSLDPLPSHIRPPPIPGKYTPDAPPLPSKLPPTPDLDAFTFSPSAYLEDGSPLRPIFLPSQLRTQFLHAASTNTRLNLETCALLCGILKSNALFITRLVLPEQTSTSDTCETLNEEELFAYCDKEDLLVIGWIHTHPTQTCFMSSRDLHTHVGYQVMMRESVAIVCAPLKVPSWGCFRLTDPPGKQAILNCTKPGIFHPHDVQDIYTEALKPGHVVELADAPLEIVDMRVKRKFGV